MAAAAAQPASARRDRQRSSGDSRLPGRLTVAAAIAAVALAGCGSGSADPAPLDQGDGGSQSQQNESNGSGGDQDTDDQDTDDQGDDGKVVRDGEGDRAQGATAAQAEKFIEDYLDAENKAIQDGDFSAVKPMVEECSICEDNWSYIEGAYRDGGRVEGALFTKPDVAAGQQRDDKIFVDVVSTISAYTTYDGSGAEVESGEAEELTYQFAVEKEDDEWQIVSGRLVQ